ncbi:MAG: CDP-alcohol phosphatidyltransferase family protein [Chloroflexota bacterium]
MLERLRPYARRAAEYPARLLARLGFTPNALTIIGLLLNGVVALVLVMGNPVLGGVLVLFANAFDMLDGALARVSGKGSRFGAFFDSTLDRYAEAVTYLGVMAWLFSLGDGLALLAAYLSIVGSLMVSYTRARAEGLGVHGEVGWLPRPERILLLALGLIFHQYLLLPVLWLLALLTNFTALQRILYARRELQPPSEQE